MTLSLPESIATYFEVSNGADTDAITRCFTEGAFVVDEGQTHRGHKALQFWIQGTRKTFDYSVKPLEVFEKGAHLTVTAQVSGNFAGSPVRLDHVFQLAGDKIASLEIR